MSDRTLGTTLKNLALALLNATLILIAVCLFLAWQLASTVNSLSTEFAQNLIDLNPVRDDVRSMTAEVAALRSDLATLRTQSGDIQSAALDRLGTRADAIGTQLTGVTARMNAILDEPEHLIDYAVDQVAGEVKSGIAEFRQCTPVRDS